MEQNRNRTNSDTGGLPETDLRYPRPSLDEADGTPRCNAYDEGYAPGDASDGRGGVPPQRPADGADGVPEAGSIPGTGGNDTDETPAPEGNGAGCGGCAADDHSGVGIGDGPAGGPDDGSGGRQSPADEGRGTLIFQVSAADGAIPLEGVQVTVMECLADEDCGLSGDTVSVLFTGPDGRTPPLTLPAPVRAWSLSERPAGSPLPYSLFNAEAELRGYYTQTFLRIPVFDGITSVQPVNLIPLPLSGGPDPVTENGLTVSEGAGETL